MLMYRRGGALRKCKIHLGKGASCMDLLQQARAEIDMVDAEMAALFERRMCAVADV